METKDMQEGSNDSLTLDKNLILTAINYSGKYEDSGRVIRKWEGEENADLFIADIHREGINYMGILNGKLQRDGYGLTTFGRDERYFGIFTANMRNRHGWYAWPSQPCKTNPNKVEREFYYGLWKDNKKDDHGVYLWLTEDKNSKPFEDFETSDFHAYIGTLANDTFKKGTYLIKQGDNYYLYYGSFDEKGKKYGDICFFYNSTEDQLICGKVENDQFIYGYLGLFDADQGTLSDLLHCDFKYENNKPTIASYRQIEEIPEEEKASTIEDLNLFRNIILNKDYFGDIFKKFKEVNEFIDENMMNLDVLDSQEKFPNIMQISVEYNNLSVFQDIEKIFASKVVKGIFKTINQTIS